MYAFLDVEAFRMDEKQYTHRRSLHIGSCREGPTEMARFRIELEIEKRASLGQFKPNVRIGPPRPNVSYRA